ncbi:MAG TPA: efflux RND transporter periplasmic adaptor subunit [Planctomycetota bacterium]|nr:efflux RND transporter periplasmic adaptor subunit [Planctomycetota bacterium]
MKLMRSVVPGILILSALAAGTWALIFHADWFRAKVDDDDEAGGGEVIPIPTVRLGKISRATLHRYVEGTGTVEAEPAGGGKTSAGSRVASPVAGILSGIQAGLGSRVAEGELLVQLDDRIARSEEEKARAAVGSARAALEKLKSIPRPDQLRLAEMQVERATLALDFSRKKHDRMVQLAAGQLASEKTLEEAALDLASAKNDQATAEKQLLLLRTSPTREELAEAQAKVVEAEKALEGAVLQRALYQVRAPIAGTVVRLKGNVGEAVDLTTVLAEIVDLDRLVVEGTVPAAALGSLRVGQPVDVRMGSERSTGRTPAASLQGTVKVVGLDVDRKLDSATVRVALPAKSPLVPGQFVRIRIVVEEHPGHLVVPRESVVRTTEGKDVIVGFLGEKAVQKPVQVGIAEGDWVEIDGDDLNEDDAVVTKGAYGLPGEAKVRVEGSK